MNDEQAAAAWREIQNLQFPEVPGLVAFMRDWATSQKTTTDMPAWAAEALGAGSDTPSLRILAGLGPENGRSEIELYFQKALDELGWPSVHRDVVALRHIRDLARAILAGRMPPQEGADRIDLLRAALGEPSFLVRWSCLAGGPESCVGSGAEGRNVDLDAEIRREANEMLTDAEYAEASGNRRDH